MLVLLACDCLFTLECACEQTLALLESVFSAFVCPAMPDARAVCYYRISGPDASGGFVVSDGIRAEAVPTADDLLFHIDKAITVALQLARPELFVLHAAALAVNGRVVVMPASPGTGKSTLTLALAQRGLEYLSDELAPVDPLSMTVVPYPHALCLKTPPPPPYELPQGTRAVNRRFHVPVASLGTSTAPEALPLAAFIFPRRDGTRFEGLQTITPASGATRLMAHLLNGLAHPHCGLDAAIALSGAVPCFELDTTQLSAAVDAIAHL